MENENVILKKVSRTLQKNFKFFVIHRFVINWSDPRDLSFWKWRFGDEEKAWLIWDSILDVLNKLFMWIL